MESLLTLKEDFTLGADPEIFLQKKDTKEFISAHEFIPGTKKEPFPLNNEEKTFILVDGVALEFNFKPCTNQKEFNNTVEASLEAIKKGLPENIEFNTTETGKFLDIKTFNSLPEEVTELGCMPDYNIWNKAAPNQINLGAFPEPFRCVAGHLHIGCFDLNDKQLQETLKEIEYDPQILKELSNNFSKETSYYNTLSFLIKMLDAYIGIPFYAADKMKGKQERTIMYGDFGSFRLKPYGVEYRVPSNYWLWNHELRNTIYENILKVIKLTNIWFQKDKTIYTKIYPTMSGIFDNLYGIKHDPKSHVTLRHKKFQNLEIGKKEVENVIGQNF